MPVAICWATVVIAGTGAMVNSMVRIVATPILMAIGTLSANRRTK